MKAKLRLFCWHLLFCLFPVALFAQQLKFFGIDVEDGLSQNTVWQLLQDRQGFLWLATADGVDRYDGYRFEHYDINAQSRGGDGSSTLLSLYLDGDGQVWSSHKRGFHRYNPHTNQFDHLVVQTTGEGEGRSFIFYDDPTSIWTIVWKKGMMRFDKKTGKVLLTDKRFAYQGTDPLSYFSMTKIHDQIFFKSDGGFILSFNTRTRTLSELPTPYNLTNLHPISLGDTALAYLQFDSVSIYNIQQKHWHRKALRKPANQPKTSFITQIQHGNKLLLGAVTGLWIINPQDWRVERTINSFEQSQNETFSYVQSFFIDRDSNLWVGTNGAGLYCSPRQMQRFPHYRHPSAAKNLVKSIAVKSSQELYVGVYKHGLLRYQLGSHAEPNILCSGGFLGVNFMAWYDSNTLLIGEQKELFTYQIKEKQQKQVALPPNCHLYALSSVPKLPNAVDVLTSEGIFRFQNNRLSLYYPVSNKFSSVLYHSSSDSLIIGSSDGLIQLAVQGRPLQTLYKTDALIKNISRYNDSLFVATVNGLFVLNHRYQLLHHFNKSNQLPNNFCYAAQRDGTGDYWVSHNQGLSRWRPSNNSWRHYGTADGLQSREFNTGAFAEMGDGRLLFGGVNGINIIDPKLVDLALSPPGCALTGIEINDQTIPTDSFYNMQHVLVLPHANNTLSFSYASLHYGNPSGQRYSYRLLGLDNQWIESNQRNFIRYANLPPGEYQFEARSRYPGEAWGPASKAFRITILPPFYLQTSFLLLSSAAITLLIFLLLRGWLRQREQKIRLQLELQQKLENERQRISRDLHDNVGAQLSYLISNLDWLADHPLDGPHFSERAKTLSAAGREAMLTLRQTIWAIGQNAISPDDFADRFKAFLLKMTQFSPDLELHFHENFATEIQQLQPAEALHCFRIGQEAVHNIIKHAAATRIEVFFESNAELLLHLRICDNGRGFEADRPAANGHNGLRNMQQRAQECGAELVLSSSAAGSCVELRLAQNVAVK